MLRPGTRQTDWRRTGRQTVMGRLGIVALAALACLVGASALAQEIDPYDRIAAANQAFEQGRFDEALADYEAAAEVLNDSQVLKYNRAAAKYRLKDYQQAADLFAQAAMAEDRSLSDRARFAWGNCEYASALDALQAADPQAGATPDLPAVIEKLRSAQRHYRDALQPQEDVGPNDPADRAARANIERSQQLIDAVEQLMQQQKQQQQNQDQQQDEQQQDQQEQQRPKQQENQQDQQQQDQDQQQDEQEDQQQDRQQNEQQEDQQPQEAQPDEREQPPESQEQPQQQQQVQQQAQQQERPMTQEEVEALLQQVRDKEQKRREEKLRRHRARREPVTKDW